jgi:regulator of telomere elongation helicase 1
MSPFNIYFNRFTRYRPNHAVLGSREQMCIHPKVNPSKSASASKRKSIQNNTPVSSSDINHACTKLNKERKCRHRNNLDGFVLTTDETTATTQSSTSTTITEQIQQPILDIEELVTLGQSRTICPFYFSRSQIPEADIIFIPYNYLFDADTRKHSLHEIEFENSIIIFDEAHNLESFASESASFDLTSIDIAGCIIEVSRCMGYVQSMPDLAENGNDNSGNGGGGGGGGRLTAENLLNLKSIFLQLEHYMEEVVPPNGGSYSGEYIFEILAKGANLTFKNHVIFVKFIRTVSDFVMDMKGGQGGSSSGGNTTSSGTPKLDHFVSCVKKVYGTPTELQSMAKARSYRVHVSPKSKGGKGGGFMGGGGGGGHGNIQGRTLSYWCFAPALAMNELAALKVRSILVTSGTLSPLPSYSLELGLHFPHTLENEHIITQEQISVRVIGKGVSGKALTSTYNRRDDAEYITELGNTIISLCRVIPDGVLIFFPSYGVMETCIERWGGPASSRSRNQNYSKKNNFFQAKKRRNSQTPGAAAGTGRYCFPKTAVSSGTNLTPWQRLLAIKAIVLEPKTSSELKDVIDEFDKFISLPKSSGCIMIGVCRGNYTKVCLLYGICLLDVSLTSSIFSQQVKFLKVLILLMKSAGLSSSRVYHLLLI